ncbi:hypothetical protein PanWU01x14_014620, partial [Parasponia andersonii]
HLYPWIVAPHFPGVSQATTPEIAVRASSHAACLTSPPKPSASDIAIAKLINSGSCRRRTSTEFLDPSSINVVHQFPQAKTPDLIFSTIVSRVPTITNHFRPRIVSICERIWGKSQELGFCYI